MYKIRKTILPNHPNVKSICEEPIVEFNFDSKREAHLFWLNSPKEFVFQNIIFDESKKGRYKIFTHGKIREVRDISNDSVRIRFEKLY